MPAALALRGPWRQGWKLIARDASYQGFSFATAFPHALIHVRQPLTPD
jgi:hypothetical protein